MRYYITIFLMILSLTACAQSYEPVLKSDSTSWISYHRELEFTLKDLAYVRTINDASFLYFAYGIDYWFNPTLVGTLREDDGRLWITYTNDPDNEILLVDMSLEVGDVFVFDEYNSITGTVVEVRHENGRKVIVFDRLSYNWYQEPIMFIEGFGRNIMPWEQYADWDNNYQSCKYDGHELAYSTPNEHFVDCEIISEAADEYYENLQDFDIYPNPVKNDLVVSAKNNSDKPYDVLIFNMDGIVCKAAFGMERTTILPLNELNDGVYLVVIKSDNKEWHTIISIAK